MKTQRQKGSNFERSIATSLIKKFEFEKHECYRTPLSGGHSAHAMKADITLTGHALKMLPVSIECKHYKDWHPGRMFDMRKDKETAWHMQVIKNTQDTVSKIKQPLMPLLVCKGNFLDPWAFMPADISKLPEPLFECDLIERVNNHCPSLSYNFHGAIWVGCNWVDFLSIAHSR